MLHADPHSHFPTTWTWTAGDQLTIDALFASASRAAGREALPRWTAASSDHAMIHSVLTATPPFSRHFITPAAMRTVPSEAITDLRRRFAYLEAIFSVPDLDLAAAWDSPASYAPLARRLDTCLLRPRLGQTRPPLTWQSASPAYRPSCAMASPI